MPAPSYSACLGLRAASRFIRLTKVMVVVDNFRSDRRSNKGIA